MVEQKNHQTTKYVAENKWHDDLFTNRENLHGKNLTGYFQVITLEIPLLSQQVVKIKES